MTYLFIGAHLDDVELSCGGTIVKLIRQGDDVHYIGLSPCHNPIKLELECVNATKTLGIPRLNVLTFGFPVRYFSNHRQEIAEAIIRACEKVKPDTVFTHSIRDRHPDHRTTAEETIRVFNGSILSYIGPWNGANIENYFIPLIEPDIDLKIKAIRCYQSQSERMPHNDEFIKGWARFYGIKARTEYAEGFEVVKIIS